METLTFKNSPNIASFTLDNVNDLKLTYTNNKSYLYLDFERELWERMKQCGDSKFENTIGRFLASSIKGMFRFVEL